MSDEEEEDEYGDEEFEDYDDDDFEEDDEEQEEEEPPPPPKAEPPPRPPPSNYAQPPGMKRVPSAADELCAAINAENDEAMMMSRAVTPAQGQRYSDSRPSTSARPPPSRGGDGRISQQLPERRVVGLPTKANMEQDARREKTLERIKRYKEICKEVKMEEVAIDDMFNMNPLSLRELCDLGRGAYQQQSVAGVQTNEDARTIDTQTEEVETRVVSAQCPEDLGLSREVLEQATTLHKKRNRQLPGWTSTAGALQGDRNRRLTNFVKRYGPIMDALLQERTSNEVSLFSHMDNMAKSDSLSACFVKLAASGKAEVPNTGSEILAERRVTGVAYSPAASVPHLLASYTPSVSGVENIRDHDVSGRGCLAVWDMSQPESPKHILTSEGCPTCCAWSPKKPHFAIAGMEEGGLCLWDVREPAANHPMEGKVVCRRPTYSTEFNPDTEGLASIASIAVTEVAEGSTGNLGEAASSSTQFQLVALDKWGTVSVWMVAEMSSSDLAGSDVDFGLRIGGRVKILLTAKISQYGPIHDIAPMNGGNSGMETTPQGSTVLSARKIGRQTYDLVVFPEQPNQFLVAADQGVVLRGSRFGQPPPPRMYVLDDPLISGKPSFATAVTSVAFSPFFPKFFLAAYSPAVLALYHEDVGLALLTIPDVTSGDIVAVKWSPAKPSAFFALDTKSTIYAYDLLSRNPTKPVHSERFGSENGQKGTVTSVEFSNSSPKVATIAGKENAAPEAETSTKEQHSFVLMYDDGRVDVHMLNKNHTLPGGLSDFANSSTYKETEEFLNRFHVSGLAKAGEKKP